MSKCSRRDFVVKMVVAGGALAIAPRLAMGDAAPAAPDTQVYWANVGPVSGFSSAWKLTPYPAEFGHKKAFVKVDDGKTVAALSPKCPHQGCAVDFDAAAKQFTCPCHAAKFTDAGAVISGPSPTALVTLQAKIDGGNVFVQSLTPPKAAAH